jgi:hypothetical protein
MPQCDGITERFNKSFKTMLRCFVNKSKDDWDEWLEALLFCINNKYDPSIGDKPSFLEYGRDLNLAVDILLPKVNPKKYNSIDEFRTSLVDRLKQAMLIADDCLDIIRSNYDQTRSDSNPKHVFSVGELALLVDPRLDRKTLDARYRGPYRVTGVSSDGRTYTLQKLGSSRNLSSAWNVKYMRKVWDLRPSGVSLTPDETGELITKLDQFVTDDDNCIDFNPNIDPDDFEAQIRKANPNTALTSDDALLETEPTNKGKPKKSNDVYEVEKISNHRIRRGVDEYLVHWVGYADPTWEPISNLECPSVVQDYWSEHRKARPLPPFAKKYNTRSAALAEN